MAGDHILVTGGAGFIGSHTCKQLAAHDFTPVTYDNLVTGNRDAVRWGPFVQGDLQDVKSLKALIKHYRPVAAIHLAAYAYVGESVVEPARYYSNNVTGTLCLLEACLGERLDKIVFSSSCATYGAPTQLPITEQTPLHPINPYGNSKLMVEQILHDFHKAYGMESAILRYFNACGADPDGELAEKHDPETHLIPRALMAAGGRLGRLEVFGRDYETPDGTCVRDYIHVQDLARAHIMALRHLLHGNNSLTVNLGSGRGISILEILEMVERKTGQAVPVDFVPRRPGDPAALYADPALAKKTLGFETQMSDLATIIETAAPTFGLEVRP